MLLFFFVDSKQSLILTCLLTVHCISVPILTVVCQTYVKNCLFSKLAKWTKTFWEIRLFLSSQHLNPLVAFRSLSGVHIHCCCLWVRLYVNNTHSRPFSGVRLLIALHEVLTERSFSTSCSVERSIFPFLFLTLPSGQISGWTCIIRCQDFCIVDYKSFSCFVSVVCFAWFSASSVPSASYLQLWQGPGHLETVRNIKRMSCDPPTVFRCCLIWVFDNVISEAMMCCGWALACVLAFVRTLAAVRCLIS